MNKETPHQPGIQQPPGPLQRDSFLHCRPVASYFALTFAVSWIGALLAAAPLLLGGQPLPKSTAILMFPATLLGPSVAGVSLTRIQSPAKTSVSGEGSAAPGTLSSTGYYPLPTLFMYAKCMLDEKDFQRKADAAFEDLKRRMLTAGDEHGFDVEGESGKLEVLFEEPEEAKFVISPNTPVREIWISALSTSFKLGWNESRSAFVHEKTGEDLRAVMSRVISQQLGAQVTL